MAFPWAAAASVLGGVMSAKGQASANAQNLAIARENRAWQTKMSNTAYQRAAADMDKAGLNRILALGSPASTPGGNVATMGNVGGAAVEGATKAANTGLAARRLKQELKNMKAVNDQVKQDTATKKANERLLRQQALNLNTQGNVLINDWEKNEMVMAYYRKHPELIARELSLSGPLSSQAVGAASMSARGIKKGLDALVKPLHKSGFTLFGYGDKAKNRRKKK